MATRHSSIVECSKRCNMIIVKRTILARQVLSDLTTNDTFNIHAVFVSGNSSQMLVEAVYRALWASAPDNKGSKAELDSLLRKQKKKIVASDFNILNLCSASCHDISKLFELKHYPTSVSYHTDMRSSNL